MKNINVEYDMDENDLNIILKDIVKEHKKKPSLAYIFENYNQLLSVFKPNVIKRTLDSISEDYKYAPNEGEESNTTLSMSSKTYLDKAKESIKNLEKNNQEKAKIIDAQPDLTPLILRTRELFPYQFRSDAEVIQFIRKNVSSDNKNNQFEDEPYDIESDPESMKEETSFANSYNRLMNNLNEAHVPEGDDEGRMIEYQLRTIRDEIDELLPMIQPNDQFEGWVQSKVTLAKDYVSAVKDYLKQHYAEYHNDDRSDDGDQGSHDMSDDAEALASAGFGTDEDYGYYGGNEDNEEVKEGVIMEKKGARCTKVTQKAHSSRPGKKWMKCVRQGGKLKRIHWGQAGVRVTGKSGNTKRKKSFKKRHKCGSAKAGTPRAMACRDWT